jgi:hypothetical protein
VARIASGSPAASLSTHTCFPIRCPPGGRIEKSSLQHEFVRLPNFNSFSKRI